MRAIFHEEIDRPKLSWGFSIATGVGIVALPPGVFTIQPHIDATFGTHTAIGNQVACNLCNMISSTSGIAIFIFGHIEIDYPIVGSHKFSISTNGSPSAIDSFQIAAAQVNSRCYSADSFIRGITAIILSIGGHIHQAGNGDFTGTRDAIHGFDAHTIALCGRFAIYG